MYRPNKEFDLPLPTEAPGYSADLAGLIGWLETQDPATEYDAGDYTKCLACRFASAVLGRETHWKEIPRPMKEFAWVGVAFVSHGVPFEKTYGAALSRARALLSAANGGRVG